MCHKTTGAVTWRRKNRTHDHVLLPARSLSTFLEKPWCVTLSKMLINGAVRQFGRVALLNYQYNLDAAFARSEKHRERRRSSSRQLFFCPDHTEVLFFLGRGVTSTEILKGVVAASYATRVEPVGHRHRGKSSGIGQRCHVSFCGFAARGGLVAFSQHLPRVAVDSGSSFNRDPERGCRAGRCPRHRRCRQPRGGERVCVAARNVPRPGMTWRRVWYDGNRSRAGVRIAGIMPPSM